MQFSEQEAVPLKNWVTKRLEDISDADSDVLADYVLALVKSDDPEEQVRSNSLVNLEDFLREHTAPFVDDVLKAVRTKSYLPGHAAPPSVVAPTASFNTPSGPANGNSTTSNTGRSANEATNGQSGQSRKRAFNDRGSEEPVSNNNGGERVYKQMRRGGARGNRHEQSNGRNFRPNQSPSGAFSAQSQFPGMPPMPTPPPGFPGLEFPSLDPNNPMAAMMAMQAMGFPSLPGFPPFPTSGSPVGQSASPTGFGNSASGQQGSSNRCVDYDTMGFCAAGNACPYEHGNDHLVVPGSNDEYDPANATLASTFQAPAQSESNIRTSSFRGRRGDRGRGRGVRHDRGGRAAFSSAGPNHDRNVKSIVVEQIPEDKFTEESVSEFFAEFGTIEEVTMQPYKRLAIVKYSDWAGAKAAYDSPKVIFDNRFVKVYWYKPEAASSAPNGAGKHGKSGGPPLPKEDEEMIDPAEFERKQAEAQKAHEEKLKKLKEAETAKEELEKRIKAQADERKALLEKLASKTGAPATSPSPVPASTSSNSTTAPNKSSSSQTEALRAKLAELQAEADSLGLPSTADDPSTTSGYPRGGYRGRGYPYHRGFAPRARGSYRGGRGAAAVNRLDNRPRTVAVSGPDWSDGSGAEEALRSHLFGIGAEFDDIARRPAAAGGGQGEVLEIAFGARYVAENFMASARDGAIPGVGKVEFAWVANKPPATAAAAAAATGDGVGDAANGEAAKVEGGDAAMGGEAAPAAAASSGAGRPAEVDYDVAEEDEDRWMAG